MAPGMAAPISRHCAIIGGGLVGICTALALLATGRRVTVFDRHGPCRETSRWNAGVLATSSVIPLNNPGLFARVPNLLRGRGRGREPGFRLDLRAIATTLPWGAQFLRNARAGPSARATVALQALIGHSRTCHTDLCHAAGIAAPDDRGWIIAYRGSSGPARANALSGALRRLAVAVEVLDPSGLRAVEPILAPSFSAAVYVTQSAFVDPPALAEGYIDLAVSRGAEMVADALTAMSRREERWRLVCRSGRARHRIEVGTTFPASSVDHAGHPLCRAGPYNSIRS